MGRVRRVYTCTKLWVEEFVFHNLSDPLKSGNQAVTGDQWLRCPLWEISGSQPSNLIFLCSTNERPERTTSQTTPSHPPRPSDCICLILVVCISIHHHSLPLLSPSPIQQLTVCGKKKGDLYNLLKKKTQGRTQIDSSVFCTRHFRF